jgi:hypothetical protein
VALPQLTSKGVAFHVRVDCVDRECIVSTEALAMLSKLKKINSDPLEVFRAFEATINGVARRLVHARVPGTPLILSPKSFH